MVRRKPPQCQHRKVGEDRRCKNAAWTSVYLTHPGHDTEIEVELWYCHIHQARLKRAGFGLRVIRRYRDLHRAEA